MHANVGVEARGGEEVMFYDRFCKNGAPIAGLSELVRAEGGGEFRYFLFCEEPVQEHFFEDGEFGTLGGTLVFV